MTGRVTVRQIWRYPVKSMAGMRVRSVAIATRGPHADRLWAVRDLELDATTTARRVPALMLCTARYAVEPPADAGPGRAVEVIITFPNGDELSSSDPAIHARLSDLVSRRVELRPLPPIGDRKQYRGPTLTQADLRRQFGIPDGQPLPDLSMFPLHKVAELARYATPIGSYADAYPLHLLTTGALDSMRALAPHTDFDLRRFRPNVLLDGSDEFAWCGGTLFNEAVALRPVVPTLRCSMPVRAQPGLDAQPDVMRTISRHNDRCLGVYADVLRRGHLSEGDKLTYAAALPRSSAQRAGAQFRKAFLRTAARFMPKGALPPRQEAE
jgi:uncharacterized protein YcbX